MLLIMDYFHFLQSDEPTEGPCFVQCHGRATESVISAMDDMVETCQELLPRREDSPSRTLLTKHIA